MPKGHFTLRRTIKPEARPEEWWDTTSVRGMRRIQAPPHKTARPRYISQPHEPDHKMCCRRAGIGDRRMTYGNDGGSHGFLTVVGSVAIAQNENSSLVLSLSIECRRREGVLLIGRAERGTPAIPDGCRCAKRIEIAPLRPQCPHAPAFKVIRTRSDWIAFKIYLGGLILLLSGTFCCALSVMPRWSVAPRQARAISRNRSRSRGVPARCANRSLSRARLWNSACTFMEYPIYDIHGTHQI